MQRMGGVEMVEPVKTVETVLISWVVRHWVVRQKTKVLLRAKL
jgi:hypothetical protein